MAWKTWLRPVGIIQKCKNLYVKKMVTLAFSLFLVVLMANMSFGGITKIVRFKGRVNLYSMLILHSKHFFLE